MNLSNKKIKDSYGGLLNIGLTGASPGTLYEVTDGMGNVLPIEISTTEVKFTGIVSGITGAAGSNGTSGTSGINGSSGTSGVNGAAGANGSSGTSGVNGANGSSGTSGVNGAAGANGSSGTSGVNGANGSSGTSGISGANGSSGTSGVNGANGSSGTSGINGVTGATGAAGSGDPTAIVNVTASSTANTKRIWSGNLTTATGPAGIFLSTKASEQPADGDFISVRNNSKINLTDQGGIQVQAPGIVWLGDNSSFSGAYSVLLGRGINNNGTDGNILMGFGCGAGGGSIRDSFAAGAGASLSGSTIGHQYGELTGIIGMNISAKMRGAMNFSKLHLSQLPGQFSWSTGTSSYQPAGGYKNDSDFYTNYKGYGGTTPSGATAGSFYSQPGGNVMIAGSTGYNYVNPSLDYADDSAAAAAGVAIGQLYHNSGAVRVRLT